MNENIFTHTMPTSQYKKLEKSEESEKPRSSLEEVIYQKMQTALKSVETDQPYYTGKEMETILFGNRSDGSYTQKTKDLLHQQRLAGLITEGVEAYHNNEKTRVSLYVALVGALGMYAKSNTSEMLAPETHSLQGQGALLEILNMMLKTRSQDKSKLSAITTVDTPMDVDYGADALVYSAANEAERKATLNSQRPTVSLGITTTDKLVKEISSNIEIYMPSEKAFMAELANNPNDFFCIVKEVFIEVQRIFDEKMASEWKGESDWRKKHAPVVINCADLLEKKKHNANLH